jgi:hypothetical protein
MSTEIVYLKCESDSPSFDQEVRAIALERETETDWFGAPLANPACPSLQWPKFAWVAVAAPRGEMTR